MKNLEFTEQHYEQMLQIDEDWKEHTQEELKEIVQKGAALVDENKGFYGLENTLSAEEMVFVGAFIDFRLAKKDLGEYVEEIDT